MSDLIQRIRDAYIVNPASALNLLPELFQAAGEGKIVELPCRMGDTVWVIFGGAIHRECIVSFQICGQMRPVFCIMNDGIDDEPEFQAYCHREDFGKTVFLTRESAEKALRSVKHEA